MANSTGSYTDKRNNFISVKNAQSLAQLVDKIGDAKYVLLGEASHGTHEYYTWRAEISKMLIQEKGFNFIAVEGDWPDCFKINSWIKGFSDTHKSSEEVLKQFKRWPTWMWANWEIAAFANWLQRHNSRLPLQKKIGFYGLDVYSLWESMEIIIDYLEKEDPRAAAMAKEAIDCFEPYGESYSYASSLKFMEPDCRDEVVSLLQEVRRNAFHYDNQPEAGLNAEINALVAANAEKYYRTLSTFSEPSWNVRDLHMVECLNTLLIHHGPDAKAIVWEHNTHIGDARATDMVDDGLFNVGQLVREQHGKDEVFLVGFGSYAGSVIAASRWGAPMQKMDVPPAIEGSVEEILHSVSPENKLLLFNEPSPMNDFFYKSLGHRAIGVVYSPNSERGNYVPTQLSLRYDAFIYLDRTKALHPLHIKPEKNLTPDTFPFGI